MIWGGSRQEALAILRGQDAARTWMAAADVNLKLPERLSPIATGRAVEGRGRLHGALRTASDVADPAALRRPLDMVNRNFS
eukprot:2934017-Pyramimonas_sp.AAC.1